MGRKKGPLYQRTTITVPTELKKRMKSHTVNWSRVASEAFEEVCCALEGGEAQNTVPTRKSMKAKLEELEQKVAKLEGKK